MIVLDGETTKRRPLRNLEHFRNTADKDFYLTTVDTIYKGVCDSCTSGDESYKFLFSQDASVDEAVRSIILSCLNL
jgi:hypothetical protein